MIWHNCTLVVWSNNSQDSMGTLCGARTGIVRAPHGNLQCFSYPAGPARVPYGSLTDTQGNWHNQNWPNSRTGVVFGRTGPVRAPQGLFTGCLQSLNPYGARKLIMHALKLYGPRTGRQNSYGAARGPCGPREWTYDFCSKQPGNVMWPRHNQCLKLSQKSCRSSWLESQIINTKL